MAGEWEQAIEYAMAEIVKHQKRIRQLYRSIGLMKQQLKAGEPWPQRKNVGDAKEPDGIHFEREN